MRVLLEIVGAAAARAPRFVLLLLALSTAFFAVGLTKLRVANDPQEFLPEDPRVEAARLIEKEFGAGNFSHLITVRFAPREPYTVESPQAIREMEAVLQALRTVPGIIFVEGIPDFVKFVRSGLHGFDRRYYSLPTNSSDELGYSFEELIRMAFQRMALLQKFISQAGTALATATVAREADIIDVARQMNAALAPLRERAVALEIGPVSYGETLDVFNRATQHDLRWLTPFVFAFIVATLAWAFRLTRPRDLVLIGLLLFAGLGAILGPELLSNFTLPVEVIGLVTLGAVVLGTYKRLASLYLTLAVITLSGVWAFGLMGWMGVPLNFLMAAVLPLLMGIGDDYAIHLLHRYEEERCKGCDGPKAIGIALGRTGRALVITTLTTVAGFAALFFTPSPPVQWFGFLAAFSIISAFVITVTLIPSAKHWVKEGARGEPWTRERLFAHPMDSLVSRWLARYTRLVQRRGVAIAALIIGIALGAFGYWQGHSFQTYSVDYRHLLPQEYPIVQLYDQINDEFRTYDEVQILLEGEIARFSVMRLFLKEIPEALGASPYAHKVTSIAHYIDDVRAAHPQLAQGFLERFVQNPDEAYRWMLSEIFAQESLRWRAEMYIAPSPFKGEGWGEGEEGSAVVRVNTMRFADQMGIARVTQDMTERLEPVIAKLQALGLSVKLTGVPYLEELGLETLRQSFAQSLILAFILCFVVISLILRSVLWGAAALFPMALMTGLVLGTVNLLRLELNAATAIVAAISIGLGVDYAVHLLQRFLEERDLVKATARTGEALFAAFVTTASAFFVLLAATITWNRAFGLLVGLAVSYAFIATALFFPALVSVIARLPSKSVSAEVGVNGDSPTRDLITPQHIINDND
ncbi:MMPL family transporter [Candidatus Acetothermia bacterium]|jgi:predicted RND superfamily exporter protein|nr:MMPL family transporter [Candidatus Acetothermia bacterium]MCI2436055.1 MMPL family transporter [Candidatus Acetothermia bacterium]